MSERVAKLKEFIRQVRTAHAAMMHAQSLYVDGALTAAITGLAGLERRMGKQLADVLAAAEAKEKKP